jgi:hypothetical protein
MKQYVCIEIHIQWNKDAKERGRTARIKSRTLIRTTTAAVFLTPFSAPTGAWGIHETFQFLNLGQSVGLLG